MHINGKAPYLIAFLFFLIPGSLFARMPTTITGESHRDYWQLWFLYEQTSNAYEKEFIVRPILPVYGSYRNIERGYYMHHVLYPMFTKTGTNYWSKWSFLGLIGGDSFYHVKEETEETDFTFPLFFWGSGDDPEEEYFGFFPFYGHFKDRIAWSEIRYVMFPLYVSWSYKDYKAHSILWPLIMWGSSPTRDDLRIWPFYSSKVHKGKYIHRSILWPLIQWGWDDLDKKEPRGYFLFIPFFGMKWSAQGNMYAYTIGYPIQLAAWGADKKTDSFYFRALWFLFQYERSNDPYIRKTIVFPFWGRYRFGRPDQTYYKEFEFWTPFYVGLNSNSSSMVTDNDYVGILFYQDLDTYYKKEREREQYIKFWPLFKYREDSYGNMDIAVPAFWPFRADNTERIWAPILAGGLFEYREYENGDRYLSFLLRSYSQYWNENETHIFVLGFEVHDEPDFWSVEFLGGLLGFKRVHLTEDESENFLRLLWFDI